jgi:hypothetical protein
MSYENDKIEVLSLFDNHIMKYIIKDLEILDDITADSLGRGGCAIPQSMATFAALDLISYLIDAQDVSVFKMKFGNLLQNAKYFPEFEQYSVYEKFFDFFRDDLRSMMVHNFTLAKFDITKKDAPHLFFEESGNQIFNVSLFTKITIQAIKKIQNEIKNDIFIINGYSKDVTMKKIKDKIEKLKDEKHSISLGLPSFTVTTNTTSSIG